MMDKEHPKKPTVEEVRRLLQEGRKIRLEIQKRFDKLRLKRVPRLILR